MHTPHPRQKVQNGGLYLRIDMVLRHHTLQIASRGVCEEFLRPARGQWRQRTLIKISSEYSEEVSPSWVNSFHTGRSATLGGC